MGGILCRTAWPASLTRQTWTAALGSSRLDPRCRAVVNLNVYTVICWLRPCVKLSHDTYKKYASHLSGKPSVISLARSVHGLQPLYWYTEHAIMYRKCLPYQKDELLRKWRNCDKFSPPSPLAFSLKLNDSSNLVKSVQQSSRRVRWDSSMRSGFVNFALLAMTLLHTSTSSWPEGTSSSRRISLQSWHEDPTYLMECEMLSTCNRLWNTCCTMHFSTSQSSRACMLRLGVKSSG